MMLDPYSTFENFLHDYPLVGVGNLQQKRPQLQKLSNIQYDYIYLCDFIDEFLRDSREYDPLQILSFTGVTFIHEINGIMLDFLHGAYTSSARTLRWILETSLGASIATIDGKILDPNSVNGPMTVKEFLNWLEKYDRNQRDFRVDRKTILTKLKVKKKKITELENTYKQLCKYTHLSNFMFSRPLSDPNFHTQYNVNPKLFDSVFSLLLKTIDVSLYSFLYSIEKVIGKTIDIKKFMKYYKIENFGFPLSYSERKQAGFLLPREIPLTWKKLGELSK